MLLIWFGSRWVSLSAVFLVAFPAFYFAVLEGLNQRDKKLNEMLTVFQLSGRRKLAAYHWPSVLPFVQAASKTAVGMSWKSGIAAEVIGLPLGSIGEGIYRGKILLNSADVFAWTVVVVVISVLAELVFLKLLERSGDWSWAWALPQTFSTTQAGQTKTQTPATTITARNLVKAYGEKTVLAGLNLELTAGQRYVISSPSGTGKTTLLRLLAGIEHPDSGTLSNTNQAAMVFQEARLFEQRSAIQNIQLVVGQYVELPTIRSVVACLLPTDALDLAVDQLSGGMRRRVELCRALLFPSQLLLLDEPFAGLDSANSAMAQELIMGMLDGRTLVISSHDLEDIEALGCQVISPK
jgi:NitT/TauT family transport system permease protein